MVFPKKKKSTASKKKAANTAKTDPSIPVHSTTGTFIQDNSEEGETIFQEVEHYAMITMDPKGNISSWNKGAGKIYGYTRQEIVGKNFRILQVAEDNDQRLSDKLLDSAKTNGNATFQGWWVRKDGTRFWGGMSLTALHDKTGIVKGYLKITTDMTETRVAEDQYSNFVEELKQKNIDLTASEELYHRMVWEVQDYAIILLDCDGKILDCNKVTEKVKGYSPKELVGKNFRLFYPKEDRKSDLPGYLLGEAKSKGSIVHEGWRIRKDGKRFWANVTITSLHDDAGNLIGFSKVTRDLTERKVAEDRVSTLMEELRQVNENLRESEERYQKMIVEVQDYAIILLDTSGNIQNWNQGAQLIKGYSAREIIGKNFKVFYQKEDQQAGLPDQLINQAKQTGRVTHEGWRVRKDGTRFWGSVVITALHNADGKVIGFSKVTRDLTERKIAEDMLKSSAAQLDLKNKSLERLNEELASFTNVASHDLKEPLRKILTFAYRLRERGSDPVKGEEYVNKIIDSSERMQALIHDLLSYSEVSGEYEKVRDVNLNDTISAITADLEILIAEKNVSIKAHRLPVVKGIPHQIQQLFFNLVSNAIKFSRAGVPPVISIHSKLIKGPDIPGGLPNGKNQYFHIQVKDNGIGFDNEAANKLFDPFVRLHPKNVYGGTGLGLAIVKKIVSNHNGIVTTESEPGVGSTFHIYLPANPA